MTRDEFVKGIAQTYQECLEILSKKNDDYATGEDPFANFRFAKIVGTDPGQAILVRISDKLARISNIYKKGTTSVKEETISDTISDACNYLAILKEYIKDQK